MAIYRLLQNSPFGPEQISQMTKAYEQALVTLGLTDRNDPVCEIVARKIIGVSKTGECDPLVIAARAIKELGIPL